MHWVAVRTGAIPVENDPRDLGSLRRALQALKEGSVLGIFPEGGRSGDGSLKTGQAGGGAAGAARGSAPRPGGDRRRVRGLLATPPVAAPAPILVRFGEPIDLPEAWRGHAAKDHLEEATALLLERIRVLSA